MRRLALLSLLGLVWLLVLVAVAVGWGPFAASSSAPMFSTGPRPHVPIWLQLENLPPNAVPGAKIFAVAGCTACHTYLGSGSQNLGAPDLTSIGTRHLGLKYEIAHLVCASCVRPGSPMPNFAALGRKRLRQLAIFLEASKGTH